MLRKAIQTISRLSICSLVLAAVLSVGASPVKADQAEVDAYYDMLAEELLAGLGIDVTQLYPDDPELLAVLWVYVDSLMETVMPEHEAEADALYNHYLERYGFGP